MSVLTRQQQIAELAEREPKISFTSINQYLDVSWLEEAYRRMRKDSAPGSDGQTVREYGVNLKGNLEDLLNRAKSGSYFAPPVKRVYIPKGTGKETRSLGMPTTEDKLLQRAVAMLLEPIYEQDFLDCSYGFRPRRSAHGALQAFWDQSVGMPIRWVLDVDIRKFYDTLDHGCLREFLQHRVRDGVIRKLIDKWLKAGVLEKGQVSYPTEGTPQGGSISPLLSNIYLHYLLDMWFAEEVRPRCRGKAFLVRFADDGAPGNVCAR